MKQFISTKLFFSLQEASQKGIDMDAKMLQDEYDKFAKLVFSENAAPAGKTAYYNALIYTHVELAGLTGVSGKKCSDLPKESYRTC
jgi:hypothetical protein